MVDDKPKQIPVVSTVLLPEPKWFGSGCWVSMRRTGKRLVST